MLRDKQGQDIIQAFAPDPGKSQVSSTLTGTKTFKKGTGGDVDITDWQAIRINPTAASSYYLNTDTTKTFPLPAGVNSDIYIEKHIQQVVVLFGTAIGANAVQGM